MLTIFFIWNFLMFQKRYLTFHEKIKLLCLFDMQYPHYHKIAPNDNADIIFYDMLEIAPLNRSITCLRKKIRITTAMIIVPSTSNRWSPCSVGTPAIRHINLVCAFTNAFFTLFIFIFSFCFYKSDLLLFYINGKSRCISSHLEHLKQRFTHLCETVRLT